MNLLFKIKNLASCKMNHSLQTVADVDCPLIVLKNLPQRRSTPSMNPITRLARVFAFGIYSSVKLFLNQKFSFVVQHWD